MALQKCALCGKMGHSRITSKLCALNAEYRNASDDERIKMRKRCRANRDAKRVQTPKRKAAMRMAAFLFGVCTRFASRLARHRLRILIRSSSEAFLYSAFSAHNLEVILECPILPHKAHFCNAIRRLIHRPYLHCIKTTVNDR